MDVAVPASERRREINELHVPAFTDVRLAMTSQDVIHDLYLPALRLKQDILPDRYTYEWFKADTDWNFPFYLCRILRD